MTKMQAKNTNLNKNTPNKRITKKHAIKARTFDILLLYDLPFTSYALFCSFRHFYRFTDVSKMFKSTNFTIFTRYFRFIKYFFKILPLWILQNRHQFSCNQNSTPFSLMCFISSKVLSDSLSFFLTHSFSIISISCYSYSTTF